MHIIIILIILLIIFMLFGLRTVHQNHVGLVETLGKYSHSVDAGVHIKIPFFQRIRIVNLATRPLTLSEYVVITKDNAPVTITVALNYSITNAKSFTYDNADSVASMAQLVRGHLRDIIGGMPMNEVLDSSAKINAQLSKSIGDLTNTFGINVDHINLDNLNPSEDIQKSMNEQMRADKDRVARISEARGNAEKIKTENQANNDAMIATATAQATSTKKKADAEKYRTQKQAEADKYRIDTIKQALSEGDQSVIENYLKDQSITNYGKLANSKSNLVVTPSDRASDFGRMAELKQVWKGNEEKAADNKGKADRSSDDKPKDDE